MTNPSQVVDLVVCGAIVMVAMAGLLRRFLSKEPAPPCLVQSGGVQSEAPALVQIGRARPRQHA